MKSAIEKLEELRLPECELGDNCLICKNIDQSIQILKELADDVRDIFCKTCKNIDDCYDQADENDYCPEVRAALKLIGSKRK